MKYIFLLILVSTCAFAEDRLEDFQARVNAYFTVNDIPSALKTIQEAEKKFPLAQDLIVLRIISHARMNQEKEAILFLKKLQTQQKEVDPKLLEEISWSIIRKYRSSN